MKILLDTNILYSLLRFPEGKVSDVINKLINDQEVEIFVSDYCIEELHSVISRKRPGDGILMAPFLANIYRFVSVITTPNITIYKDELQKVRDEKDRPILLAALYSGADIILTGDKDLLDADIDYPKIMSPSEF